MAWFFLLLAGVLEIGWAIGLKYTHGFSRPLPSVLTALAIVLSMVFLSLAVRTIPIGTGYAIWTGIGAAGTALLGMVLFNEPVGAARLVCLGMIVAGVLGLKLAAG